MAYDRSIVDEEQIGDVAEALDRVTFVRADRFVREVAARGHDGHADLAQDQMVKRCVREHDAERGIAGRH